MTWRSARQSRSRFFANFLVHLPVAFTSHTPTPRSPPPLSPPTYHPLFHTESIVLKSLEVCALATFTSLASNACFMTKFAAKKPFKILSEFMSVVPKARPGEDYPKVPVLNAGKRPCVVCKQCCCCSHRVVSSLIMNCRVLEGLGAVMDERTRWPYAQVRKFGLGSTSRYHWRRLCKTTCIMKLDANL